MSFGSQATVGAAKGYLRQIGIVSTAMYGITGSGDETSLLQSAITEANTNGWMLHFHKVITVSASLTNFHDIRKIGPGGVTDGTDTFYVEAEKGSTNKFYVATTGSDSNDGLFSSTPVLTLQKAFDIWENYAQLPAKHSVKVAAGTYTEGAAASSVNNLGELEVEGNLTAGVPDVIIDGTTATKTSGLNFNAMGAARVKYVNVRDFSSSGIAFQNGTRGVVDTCDASNNAFADFNASEDAELVVNGVCNIGSGSRYGIRVYRNSGASVGDGTNLVTIDGATEAGIQSRDGSKVVCDNNITVNNCVSGVRLIKDGYVELRTSTISNNTTGIFADSNSQFDNQTGTITFTSNTVDKRFLGFSVDRSELNVSGNAPFYLRPYNTPKSGDSPASNYDIVIDGDRASGIQALLNNNTFYIDANKTERIVFDAVNSRFRFYANNNEVAQAKDAPTSGRTGFYLLHNDGTNTTLKNVRVGAADSGGTGQRALTVDN